MKTLILKTRNTTANIAYNDVTTQRTAAEKLNTAFNTKMKYKRTRLRSRLSSYKLDNSNIGHDFLHSKRLENINNKHKTCYNCDDGTKISTRCA